MASLDFPSTPANNQVYTLNGVQYYYNGVIGAWLTNLITNPLDANTLNTQIFFNDAGYANGNPNLRFDKLANTLYVSNVEVATNVTAAFFIGDGSKITGIAVATSYDTANAAYGRANTSAQLAFRTIAITGNTINASSNASTLTIGNSNNIVVLSNTVNSSLQITQNPSGVTPSTYGGTTAIPVIVIDAFGRVTAASNTSAASQGVTSLSAATGITLTPNPITATGTIGLEAGVIPAQACTGGISALTTDNFGRVISVTASAGYLTSLTGTSGQIFSSGGSTPTVNLISTGVTASTYGGATFIPVLNIDAFGRITGASNVAVQGMDYAYTNTVWGVANAAYTVANAAFEAGNNEFTFSNTIYAAVNSAFGVINAAYTSSNADYVVSNAAFAKANTALQNTTGTLAGALTTTGSITSNAYVYITASDGVNEGGEIQLSGAGTFTGWSLDAYQNNYRVFARTGSTVSNVNFFHAQVGGSIRVGVNRNDPTYALDVNGSINSAGLLVNGVAFTGGGDLTAANNWANTKVAAVTSNGAGRVWANTVTDAGGTETVYVDLATSGVTATIYGGASAIPVITVDAYGRVTAAANQAITSGGVTSVSGTATRITSTGGTTPVIDLATAGAGAATYSSGISAVTVDAYGRVTAVTGSAGYAPAASPTFTGTVTMNANMSNTTLSDASGTISWDVSTAQIATVTLTAAGRTLANPTNLKVGSYILHILQDATGSRTITSWGTAYKFPGGVKPTLSTAANARDVLSMVSDGTNLYCAFMPAMS